MIIRIIFTRHKYYSLSFYSVADTSFIGTVIQSEDWIIVIQFTQVFDACSLDILLIWFRIPVILCFSIQ